MKQEDEKVLCHKCGERKPPDEFINKICRACVNRRRQEVYRQKNPSARRCPKVDPNDFHCRKCGQEKKPEEFIYDKGRRTSTCRDCDRERRRKIYHQKNPQAEYREKFDPDDFRCTRCGEPTEPENFKYVNGRRQGLCKACINERWIELYHQKSPASPYKATKVKRVGPEFDFGAARHLVGKYRVCPRCGHERRLSDFSQEQLITFNYGRFIFKFREFFEECADCRNRIYVLHDHFIANSY